MMRKVAALTLVVLAAVALALDLKRGSSDAGRETPSGLVLHRALGADPRYFEDDLNREVEAAFAALLDMLDARGVKALEQAVSWRPTGFKPLLRLALAYLRTDEIWGAHRALADACLTGAVLRRLVSRRPALTTVGELFALAPPLSFADAEIGPPAPSPDQQPFAQAIAQGRTVSIIYDGGTRRNAWRQVRPRAVVQLRGSTYVVAQCLVDGVEKSFRLSRVRQTRLEPG